MAVTRIKNNQITDNTIEYQKIKDGTLVGAKFNANLTLNSNLTIVGNLAVSGNTTTINSTNTSVNDPILVFNSGYTGSLAGYSIGLLVNRNLASLSSYGSVNTAWVWDENTENFVAIATTDTGTGISSINNSGWANIKVGNITVVNSASFSSITVGSFTATSLFATNFSTGNARISGGYIDSTPIGVNTASTGNFTTANATAFTGYSATINTVNSTTGNITTVNATDVNATTTTTATLNTTNGNATTLVATNFSTGNARITGGYADNYPIGANTASTGNFTTANATSFTGYNATITTVNSTTGNITTVNATDVNASTTTTATLNTTSGNATTLVATNLSSGNARITGGYADNYPIGPNTASTGNFTTANATSFTGYTATVATINSTSGNITTVTSTTGNITNVNAVDTTSVNVNSTNGNVTTLTAGTATAVSVNATNGNVTTLIATNFSTGNARITGGYADNFPIGANTKATGAFTTLTADGATTFTSAAQSDNPSTGALVVTGGVGIGANLNVAGNVTVTGNLTILGNTTILNTETLNVEDLNVTVAANAASGAAANGAGLTVAGANATFTYLNADDSWNLNKKLNATTVDAAQINVTNANVTNLTFTNAAVTTLYATNFGSANAVITGGSINNTIIGNTTPADATFALLKATGNIVAGSGVNATNYTTGALVVPGGGGVGITGDLWVQGPSTFAGNIVAGNIQLSGNINVPVGGTFSNTGVFFGNAGGIGALYAGTTTYTALPTTVLQLSGNVDTYAQVNFQNINAGTKASTDLVLTADNGNDTDGFIDLGINSSTFNDPAYPGSYPNDGYLIHHSALSTGNLVIFSHTEGSAIKLHVGDYGDANTRATITSTGLRVNTSTASTSTTSGALIVDGGVGVAGTINTTNFKTANAVILGGYIDSTPIGPNTASTGNFTTANATAFTAYSMTAASVNTTAANVTTLTSPTINGGAATIATVNTTTANITGGVATTLVVTNFSSGNAQISGGYADGFTLGGNTAASAKVTTLVASGNVVADSGTASTSNVTGALVVSGTGGLGVGGNLNVGFGAAFNTSKTATYDFTVKGKTDNTLIWGRAGSTYDQVIIGNSATTSTLVTGAKLIINSTDSFIVPVGSTAQRPGSTGGTDTVGMLRFNSSNGKLEVYDGAEWDDVGGGTTIITSDSFNGDDTTTVFTLSQTTTTAAAIVSINGVVQIPTTSYGISGTTLTFTEAPASGDLIEVRTLVTATVAASLGSPNGFVSVEATNSGVILKAGAAAATDRLRLNTGGALENLNANTAVATANTLTTIDTFAKASFRSAKYMVQSSTTGGKYQIAEVLVVHDDTTSTRTVYGITETAGNVGTFETTISGSDVLLQYVAAQNNTNVRIYKIYNPI